MQPEIQNICDPVTGNISEYLRLNAERFPDKPALLYPVKITYKELDNRVNHYSYWLDHEGIKAGTMTILMVPAGPRFLIYTFALLRIGAVPVMIDPGMGIRAMAKALAGVKSGAFIGIPKAHLLRLLYPKIFMTIKKSIIAGSHFLKEKKSYNKFLKDKIPVYPPCPVDDSCTAAIFFTSGSTGQPKGVIYTTGMLRNQIRITKSQFKIGTDETDLCTFPLLGLFAICHGNSSVIADMDMIHPAVCDPAKVIKNIKDFGCTQMFGSPVILNRLSQYGLENGIKLPTLRHVISAGAPVHRSVLESFSRLVSNETRIHTPYGATEALPVTDILASDILQIAPGESENNTCICIGYPVKDIDVRIIEISDLPVAIWSDTLQVRVNETGEIVVKGPWVTTEYYNNESANTLSKIRDPKTDEIWHRTGDLGKIDSHGRLWFMGRKSQRVITAEGTLFTIPCEAVFNSHPSVARSALIGIPLTGSVFKRPVICIQLKTGFHPAKKLSRELLELAASRILTKGISDLVFYKKFPVDPRHNAKIFREKLVVWTQKKIK